MFTCHACGSTAARDETVDEVFNIDGHVVMVENIPAQVCARCGEAVFSKETTERIRRMVHGEASPSRSECLDVFAFG
jgi:YgiT-type zinc finger domain-containing protein